MILLDSIGGKMILMISLLMITLLIQLNSGERTIFKNATQSANGSIFVSHFLFTSGFKKSDTQGQDCRFKGTRGNQKRTQMKEIV